MKDTLDTSAVAKRLAVFEAACRDSGVKVTVQRRAVFAEVAKTVAHPDAETVWRRVRERLPRISLDTVYRTLSSLESLGLISRVGAMSNSFRFDANTERHDHFICTRCGLIRDIEPLSPPAAHGDQTATEWGRVNSVHTELRGVCRDCLKSAG